MSDRPKDDPRANRPGLLAPTPESARTAPHGIVPDEAWDEASEDEVRAAEALRDALARGDGAEGLRAAFAPATLSRAANERLLERALGVTAAAIGAEVELERAEVEPAPTGAEARAAATLRTRVDGGLRPDPDAEPDDEVERLVDVARALRHAHAPTPIDELTEARIRRGALTSPKRRGRVVVTTLAALAVAAAAAFAILPRTIPGRGPATAALVPARSTQELFDPAEPFPREGGASERIDRISASRSADLRQNRFAAWGVK